MGCSHASHVAACCRLSCLHAVLVVCPLPRHAAASAVRCACITCRLAILAAAASSATSLSVSSTLRLKTAASAAMFARAAPAVTHLRLDVSCATTLLAATTVLGLMGDKLQSLTLRAPYLKVDALAVLGVCGRGLQRLCVHAIGGRLGLWGRMVGCHERQEGDDDCDQSAFHGRATMADYGKCCMQ